MSPTTIQARLKRFDCPGCCHTVVLEHRAKEGDVLLCPNCECPLEIGRKGERLQLRVWEPRTRMEWRQNRSAAMG